VHLDHFSFLCCPIMCLASSAVDRGIEPQSGQIKDDKIFVASLLSKHH